MSARQLGGVAETRPLTPLTKLLALLDGPAHIGPMLMRFTHIRTAACLLGLAATLGTSFAADNPFLGGWELTIPGGGAGWLGVEEANGGLKASLLWGGGSVVPLDSAKLEMGRLILESGARSVADQEQRLQRTDPALAPAALRPS